MDIEILSIKPALERVRYNTYTYRRHPKSKDYSERNYFQRHDFRGHVCTLHQDVWIALHGPVPPDHEIYHLDGNGGNNRDDNLGCIPVQDYRQILAERKDAQQQAAIPRVNHGGLPPGFWQSQQKRDLCGQLSRRYWATVVPKSYVCQHCGASFWARSMRQPKYCKKACGAAARKTRPIPADAGLNP